MLNEITPLYQNNSKIEDVAHADHVSLIANAIKVNDSPHHKNMIDKLKGASINSFAIGKSSEIDASQGELLSDIRDYEGRDAGETLARIASP